MLNPKLRPKMRDSDLVNELSSPFTSEENWIIAGLCSSVDWARRSMFSLKLFSQRTCAVTPRDPEVNLFSSNSLYH